MTTGFDATVIGRYDRWPDLTRFYPGLTFAELLRTPNCVRKLYVEAIPRVEARERLNAIEVSSFPNMKKEGRRSIIRRLERFVRRAEKPTSHEDLLERARGTGIGVKVVKKKAKGAGEGESVGSQG